MIITFRVSKSLIVDGFDDFLPLTVFWWEFPFIELTMKFFDKHLFEISLSFLLFFRVLIPLELSSSEMSLGTDKTVSSSTKPDEVSSSYHENTLFK